MPASLRAHMSRGLASSGPYDRRSPSARPVQSENPLVHPHLPLSLPPALAVQEPEPEPEPETPADHPGLPTYADYKRIEADYLHSLSPRKRDKALITQATFDKIWDVLHQPEACTIETPQFRFWVRKMFTLSRPMYVGEGGWGVKEGAGSRTYPDMASDSDAEGTDLELERALVGIEMDGSADSELFSAVVLHENRPVAIVEQLYELFCYCHVRSGHGGRDKTCAVIRQHYSWVPKELTAQFVKACPTCVLKRSGQGHGGVGMGVLVQRRAAGRRERERRGARLEEVSAPVVPSSVGDMAWPTTGGPLDPGNPGQRGVSERAWPRAGEDARSIDPSNLLVSPARVPVVHTGGFGTRPVPSEAALERCIPSEWVNVSQTLATDGASPLRLCDRTNRPVATGSHCPSATHESRRSVDPTRAGLPSIASALSDESLDDENVSLAGRGPETGEESLPPVLRPLRLSGPAPCGSESRLFQIDPLLLAFNDHAGSQSTTPCGGMCHCLSNVVATSELHRTADRCGTEALAMRYHCSPVDEVGLELAGTFSFSIMTDG